MLGVSLPLAGTVYVAARERGCDGRAPAAPLATDGSLPLRETQRSEPSSRPGCPAHLSLSGTRSRGKSRHFKKLRPLTRGDLDEWQLENKSSLVNAPWLVNASVRSGLCSLQFGLCVLSEC